MSEISDLIQLAKEIADELDEAVIVFDEREKRKKHAPIPIRARVAEIHDG